MGGQNSKQKISGIDTNQWKQIGAIDGVDFLRNQTTNREGELRVIPVESKSLEEQFQIYHYRKNQNFSLVECYGAELAETKGVSMCGNRKYMKVLTEKIHKRWSQLPQLTFSETIYALRQSLKGYGQLYSREGSFGVTQEMVGINRDGNVKVWCNENWARNNFEHQKTFLQATSVDEQVRENNTEAQMVENIVDVIEERCEEGRYPSNFKEKFLKNSHSFKAAQNELQVFCKQTNFDMVEKIHPNPDMIYTKQIQAVPIYREISHLLNSTEQNRISPRKSFPIQQIIETNEVGRQSENQTSFKLQNYQSLPIKQVNPTNDSKAFTISKLNAYNPHQNQDLTSSVHKLNRTQDYRILSGRKETDPWKKTEITATKGPYSTRKGNISFHYGVSTLEKSK